MAKIFIINLSKVAFFQDYTGYTLYTVIRLYIIDYTQELI